MTLSCTEKNLEKCNCENLTCKNRGKCCDCIRRHRDELELASLPFCLRAYKA